MATSIHPQVATAVTAVARRPRAARIDPQRLAVAGAAIVAGAGLTIVVAVEVGVVTVRTAATATVLLTLLLAVGRETAQRVLGHRHERHHLAVDARTADELDRLAGDRWTVRHGVPVGDGRTAHLVANDHEVHLVVAEWVTPRQAALRLRCTIAAAHAAARELEELDRRGRGRRVVPTVVAWGGAAEEARATQTAASQASVLLPGELWSWRVARGRPAATADGRPPWGPAVERCG